MTSKRWVASAAAVLLWHCAWTAAAIADGTATEPQTPPPEREPAASLPAPSAHALPDPSAAEDTSAEDDLSAEALLQALGAEEVAEPRILVYGFMDAGLQKVWRYSDTSEGVPATDATSFVSGNTNVYLDVRPEPRWRGLVETRLTLLPHGDYKFEGLGLAQRTDTNILDSTSPSGRNRAPLGGVVVERAQMEWMWRDWFNVRVGYFFTPWGIWNVDHGTPTLIALMMPTFLVQQAVPQRQTGIELFGRLNGPPWQLAYHFTVTNGRTATLFDLTEDKALGGRLVLRHAGDTRLALGVSGFWGNFEDETKTVVLGADGKPRIDVMPTVAYNESSLGADLSVDYWRFRIRFEGMVRRVQYKEGLYEMPPSVPDAFLPNRLEWYGYLIVAYRLLPWLEPYVYAEALDTGKRSDIIESGGGFSGGLTIFLSPAMQIKAQYSWADLANFAAESNRIGFFAARLVMAF